MRIPIRHCCAALVLQCVAFPVFAALQVFACEPEWKALAEAIGGPNVGVYLATTALQDPHHIEARPSLIGKARDADIMVCSGAELEIGWLPILLNQASNPRIQVGKPGYFMAADYVERLDVHAHVDRSMGDVHAAGNPHIHLDPYRLLQIAHELQRRFALIDPAHSAEYLEHYQSFAEQWRSAIRRWELKAAPLKGKKAIVYHSSWRYLFAWLHIQTLADLEPKPGLPPSAAHLQTLLSVAREQKPDFIVVANYQSISGAEWLAKRTGLSLVQLPFSVGGSEKADSLFALYDETLERLLLGALSE